MRCILTCVFVFSLALAPIGIGSPTGGAWSKREKLPANEIWKTTKTFRGGERACVLVVGDHKQKEIPHLHVKVYDKSNQLILEDKNNTTFVGDYVGIIWYPPRDGEYHIEVHNPSSEVNQCWIAIK